MYMYIQCTLYAFFNSILLYMCMVHVHKSSVGLSSTTNLKPRGTLPLPVYIIIVRIKMH